MPVKPEENLEYNSLQQKTDEIFSDIEIDPATLEYIKKFALELRAKPESQYSFEEILAKIPGMSIWFLGFIMVRLKESKLITNEFHIYSLDQKRPLQIFSSFEEIPEIVHDDLTDEDIKVCLKDIKVILKGVL